MRLILDTNVLVSHLFWPDSPLRSLVRRLMREHVILRSAETFAELTTVLLRRKFDAYMSVAPRVLFLAEFYDNSLHVMINERIDDCRDPRDNKFLELAVAGKAECLVTGDADLMALNPFRGIRIVDPAGFIIK